MVCPGLAFNPVLASERPNLKTQVEVGHGGAHLYERRR